MSVLKIKDQNGQWTDVLSIKGEKGDNGQDYVLTENDKQEIAQDVAELVDIPVDDVQINGTSIVSDGVAEIPIASETTHGVVKVTGSQGISKSSDGTIYLGYANDANIKNGNSTFAAITSANQHKSVFYGLAKSAGDTTQSASNNAVGTYTDDAKASIQSMLGVPSEDEVITDVQIDGTSIITDNVAEIPVANMPTAGTDAGNLGLICLKNNRGISQNRNDKSLFIDYPTTAQVKNGNDTFRPVTTAQQHIATFYGLAKVAGHDEKDSTLPVGQYTSEAKASIQSMFGVPSEDEVVTDVQINGTSVVENGVAEIPIAEPNGFFGVVKLAGKGLYKDNSGILGLYKATIAQMKKGTDQYSPIVSANEHESTFYGLAKAAGSDEKDSTLPVGQYTDSAKTAIKQMLGVKDDYDSLVVEVSGTDPLITGKASYRYNCGELYTLSITPPETGTMDIIFTSGATPTVLTLPNTVKMPIWWAGIETNTTYEMCITDGVYCGVMSWAT